MKLFYLFIGLMLFVSCADDLERTPFDGPANGTASDTAACVLDALKNRDPRTVLFGHQDDAAYGVRWFAEPGRSDVLETTGQRPAVLGWDLGDIELGEPENLDSVSFDLMAEETKAAFSRGTLSTFSWHARNPITGGDTWDVSAASSVESILNDDERRAQFDLWLNRVADFFIRVAPTPVLFRPFHEMNGDWFWWGADLEAFQALWRYAFEFINARTDNVLWVFAVNAPSTVSVFERWYPGDNFVDVVGFDDYESVRSTDGVSTLVNRLRFLSDFAERGNKVAALTETGLEGITNSTWYTDVLLTALSATDHNTAWALTWRNANETRDRPGHFYAPYPEHPSAEDFRKFADDPNIGFEDATRFRCEKK